MTAICTQLLVSVRDAAEARIALEAGADIIDVKEPDRGSLGRADDATIAAVDRLVSGRRLVTAALGELLHEPILPAGFGGWVKAGLAGCAGDGTWRYRLQRFAAASCSHRLVVAAYADWQLAKAPHPWDVCQFATEIQCAGMLIDTCNKDGRTLLDWLPLERLSELLQRCHEAGLRLALAGALREAQIDQLLPLEPDIIAVRGAACREGARRATIDGEAVARLVKLVHRSSRKLMSTISVEGSARASFGNHLSTIPASANSSQV